MPSIIPINHGGGGENPFYMAQMIRQMKQNNQGGDPGMHMMNQILGDNNKDSSPQMMMLLQLLLGQMNSDKQGELARELNRDTLGFQREQLGMLHGPSSLAAQQLAATNKGTEYMRSLLEAERAKAEKKEAIETGKGSLTSTLNKGITEATADIDPKIAQEKDEYNAMFSILDSAAGPIDNTINQLATGKTPWSIPLFGFSKNMPDDFDRQWATYLAKAQQEWRNADTPAKKRAIANSVFSRENSINNMIESPSFEIDQWGPEFIRRSSTDTQLKDAIRHTVSGGNRRDTLDKFRPYVSPTWASTGADVRQKQTMADITKQRVMAEDEIQKFVNELRAQGLTESQIMQEVNKYRSPVFDVNFPSGDISDDYPASQSFDNSLDMAIQENIRGPYNEYLSR